MSFEVIENPNPVIYTTHQMIVNVLFLLRNHDITIHQVTPTFFHIRQGIKVIGFCCDQLMAIERAFDHIGVLLPVRLKGMVERRYRQQDELRRIING